MNVRNELTAHWIDCWVVMNACCCRGMWLRLVWCWTSGGGCWRWPCQSPLPATARRRCRVSGQHIYDLRYTVYWYYTRLHTVHTTLLPYIYINRYIHDVHVKAPCQLEHGEALQSGWLCSCCDQRVGGRMNEWPVVALCIACARRRWPGSQHAINRSHPSIQLLATLGALAHAPPPSCVFCPQA